MSLRDVMAFIQKHQTAGAADTPDTPSKHMGYQLKPAWIGACTPDTPDTPHLYEVGTNAPIARPGAAANDHDVGDVATPASPAAPALEALDWRALDAAYLAHHAHCHVCQAAGRSTRYGLRCGAGAALWTAYDSAVTQPGALPWQQQAGRRRD